MNMAEARPRPKPRPRQKSMPAANTNYVGRTFPSSKPATKPKPQGYKTLNYGKSGLVEIKKDIDFEDRPTPIGVENEQNNNVMEVKDVCDHNDPIGALLNNVDQTAGSYNKPLPPLPVEDIPVFEESDKTVTKGPEKPPRMTHFCSDSQLETVGKQLLNCNVGNSDSQTRSLLNVARKPATLPDHLTTLKDNLVALTDKSQDSTSLLQVDSQRRTPGKLTPPLPRKPTFLTPGLGDAKNLSKPATSISNSAGPQEVSHPRNLTITNTTTNTTDLRRTPPLPRKPIKDIVSSVEMTDTRSKNRQQKPGLISKGLGRTNATPEWPLKKSEVGDAAAEREDRTRRRLSSGTGEKERVAMRRSRLSNTSNPSSFEDTGDTLDETKFRRKPPNPPNTPLPPNPILSTSPPTKPPPTRPAPPKNPSPNLPSRPPTSKLGQPLGPSLPAKSPPPLPKNPPPALPGGRGLSRREPPQRPKRPSLPKSSDPPPLPQAPRPFSLAHEKVEQPKMQRSMSADDILDADDDDTYWVAYQHLKQSAVDAAAGEMEVTNDEYTTPDENVVKGLVESLGRKTRAGPVNAKSEKKKAEIQKKHFDRATTYSSSSDDEGYVDVDAPSKPVSSKTTLQGDELLIYMDDDKPAYVEAISGNTHHINHEKPSKPSSLKALEFQSFGPEEDGSFQPKLINWEYDNQESDDDFDDDDDSDGYCEPDEDPLFGEDGYQDEEPLYQIYQANVFEKERTLSLHRRRKSAPTEHSPAFSGTVTMRSGTLRGGRMLWSQLPEVRNSGILENIDGDQRKLQEAIFEVISSEASYLKSLNLLLEHFIASKVFENILDETEISQLFSSVDEIIKVSERFLDDLRKRQRQSIIVESISDIINDHATNHFEAYVTYCSTQYKQDRMLSDLKRNHVKFAETLEKLECDKRVFGLSLQSFLVLPMQRVTRYPLLVDAIVRRCEPGHESYYKTDAALKAVNKVVYLCNEGARKEERYEEMLEIKTTILFIKVDPIELVTKDRWLLRRGPLQLLEFDMKATLSNTLHRKFRKYRLKNIYVFLFNDLLLVTKKKSDTMYSVIDFANRNMIRVDEPKSNTKNAFTLVFLENHVKKTKELTLRTDNETDMTRWKEAFVPPEAEGEDEKIYGTWDCPQVHAIHHYHAQQSDELSLVPGDVVNVLRKLPDGWNEGERIRDGVCGWFPANHTEEIRNEHVRARNLHQRYRLLAASTAFLDNRKR